MTLAFFEEQIKRLEPLGRPTGDDAMDAYFDTLKDIPGNVFDAAVGHALKTRAWYPKPAELRVDADHVSVALRPQPVVEAREVPLAQPFTITVPEVGTVVSITREWKYYCERCSDVGWASWWCGPTETTDAEPKPQPGFKPWYDLGRCQRRREHAPHEWAGKCACWDSNPALVSRREAQRKYAETPNKVS